MMKTNSPCHGRTNFTPLQIGNRFMITPPESSAAEEGRIQIKMARGAFGSGDHETTRSCLEIMENLNFPQPPKILDFGSGTGILAIAALKLFGGNAWCLDIEEAAIASARHNCELNRTNSVVHHCGPLDTLTETGFDLILANIYGDILLDVAANLVQSAASGAIILLSGILWEYNYDIREGYQRLGCTLLKNLFLEDFSTVLLQKT